MVALLPRRHQQVLPSLSASLRPRSFWPSIIGDVANAVSQLPTWLRLSHQLPLETPVLDDFLGINVATSPDPRCDAYILAALEQLDVRCVRLDFTYSSRGGDAQRLLDQLLAQDIDVMLDIFPPRRNAQRIADNEQEQTQWREFVQWVMTSYGNGVSIIEVGSTPNRGRWSGFDARGFLTAWQIASEVVNRLQPAAQLAGPNVSDFEPVYSLGFLRWMHKLGCPPSIHTVNLFVERVMQPEVSDHRALGRWATDLVQLNLVKKARILTAISQQQGIEKTVCSYNCWTRKRLARENVEPLVKQVDYLVRYLLIAAASGTLDRVYWGPLICNRDGLIDCGDANYPEIDNVSFHAQARGCVDDYQKLPAFSAMQGVRRSLRGANRIRAVSADNGITHVAVVDADENETHIVWCVDGCIAPLSLLYPSTSLEGATFESPIGETLASSILNVTEHPLLISWPDPAKVHRPNAATINGLADVRASGIVHGASSQLQSVLVDNPEWRGVVALPDGAEAQPMLAHFLPEALRELEEERVLRDKRNRLWNVRIGNGLEGLQTVKLNRARGIKRFTYRFTASKGLRHWNNATEMLRRGISTPLPLAFFERPRNSGIRDNYYVCEFVAAAFSCRDVFTALSAGEETYRGIERQHWLSQIAAFVAGMHHRGVVHNDLSSGNVIMTLSDEGDLQFYLIDIGRATIGRRHAYSSRGRFADLNRICYKLSWADRETFVQAYNDNIRGKLPRWWRLPLWSYDAKQTSKKLLKGNYRRKSAIGRHGAGRSA